MNVLLLLKNQNEHIKYKNSWTNLEVELTLKSLLKVKEIVI